VGSAGPLLAILGFLVLPLVWSVPEAMITAELATAFPENSGYVAYVPTHLFLDSFHAVKNFLNDILVPSPPRLSA
jgi:hypothetical protein